jgi:methylthioribose-1-phosphate isomerase
LASAWLLGAETLSDVADATRRGAMGAAPNYTHRPARNLMAMAVPPVIEWRDGAVRILDQRRLPDAVEVLHCTTVEQVNEAIRTLAIRGAPALGVAAAYAVALGATRIDAPDKATYLERLDSVIDQVIATRPTAVNLAWAAERLRNAAREPASDAPEAIRARLLDLAHEIAADNEQRHRALAGAGADLFASGQRVLHHCNTGPLATAASYGTALGVLQAANQRHGIEVVVSETRPLLQGGRLTTWELTQWGVPFTLITDSMAADRMRRGGIDAVIVGADRIAANGDVANKIGTYSHAVAAAAHGLPFYVAAPLSTVDFDTPNGDAIPIEERATEEVHGYGDWRWAPGDAPVANPAFDVTPHQRITAIITEHGVHRPPFVESLGRLAAAPESAAEMRSSI